MPSESRHSEIRLLLAVLERGYDHTSWHGPNLKASLRGLRADQAIWRTDASRKCIAEIALHAAYWKYAARRRLRGDKRGSFPLKGSNWFPLEEPFTPSAWRRVLSRLDAEHLALHDTVAGFASNRLHRRLGGGTLTAVGLICGVAAHDVYHAGQIQLIRRMQAEA